MTISLIAAASENNIIGMKGQLPWRLPADFRYFKKTTLGHPVIMGRKTFLSLGKPLPERTNIVVTRKKDFEPELCVVKNSLEDAVSFASRLGSEEIFVIGGGEIYRQALPLAQRIYLTRVHAGFDGDTRFPEINSADWREMSRIHNKADEKNPYDFTFFVYEKATRNSLLST